MTKSSNQFTFAVYMLDLVSYLDRKRPYWRKDHVIMLDSCGSHKTPLIDRPLSHHKVPVLYAAPGSYGCVPAEKMFGILYNKTVEIVKDESIK